MLQKILNGIRQCSSPLLLVIFLKFVLDLFNLISASGIICAQHGQCSHSIFLATVAADDSDNCLNKCSHNHRCNYGTFNNHTKMCTFFPTCTRIERDILCKDCLTSSKKCYDCFFPGRCSVSYYLLFKMIQRLVEFHSCTMQLRWDMVAKLS